MRGAFRHVAGLYWGSGLATDVPSLAWYLLSSLVPLALGLTALASLVLGDYAEAQQLAAQVAGVLPEDVDDQIVQLVLRTDRDSPLLIAGSILGMVWASSLAIGVIEGCLVRLLDLESSDAVRGTLRNLGIAAALAVLIVLAVLVASAGAGLADELKVDGALARLAAAVVSTVFTAAVCAALYRVLARGSVSWTGAFAGGAVSGVMLQATPTGAGLYMRYVAGTTPVDLFLVLAGVLITCYLVGLGLLLGAGVAAGAHLDDGGEDRAATRATRSEARS